MNIQRYKWPAIIAAGLHGALFLSYSHSTVIDSPTLVGKSVPPLRRDPDPIIQVENPEQNEETLCAPTLGGPAVPDLPEAPPLLTDAPVFTTPVIEHALSPMDNKSRTGYAGGTGIDLGGLPGGTIPDVRDLDRVPRATVQASPYYPPTLHQEGISGSVTVEFDVNIEGRVIRAEAVHCTRREFAEAAVRAVLKWRFEPGRRDGRAVPFHMAIPIEFGLPGRLNRCSACACLHEPVHPRDQILRAEGLGDVIECPEFQSKIA